jgi:hypothetical protein
VDKHVACFENYHDVHKRPITFDTGSQTSCAQSSAFGCPWLIQYLFTAALSGQISTDRDILAHVLYSSRSHRRKSLMNVSTPGPLYGGTICPFRNLAGDGLGSNCRDKSQYDSYDLHSFVHMSGRASWTREKKRKKIPVAVVWPKAMDRPTFFRQHLT